MMEHIIYKITNSLNQRFYVGMHSTKNIDDGYLGSGRRIKAEIKKYGKENFVREILEHLPSREALKIREAEIVCEALMQDPLCLNLKNGGEGGWKFDQYQQIRAASAGGKITGKINIQSMLTPERMAKSLETRRQGKLFGDKAARIAAALPANVEKRKATFAERNHMQGEKNSQYGTCWVTDQVKPIKIKKEQLDEYLAKGFVRGRTQETFMVGFKIPG